MKPLDGGQVLGHLHVAGRRSRHGKRHPAVIASEYGKGRVVYFPASVDKGMFFYPDAYMRQMLVNACRGGRPRDDRPPSRSTGR